MCRNLWRLPNELGEDLASLKYLLLARCRSLERLPDSIGSLKSLIELDISNTSIKELPDSIGELKNLKVVKMPCGPIRKIPDALWTIEKLEEIAAAKGFAPIYERCHVKIGSCIYRNQSLRILRLQGVAIHALPPRLPESLIELQLSKLDMDTFPNLSNLTKLKMLKLTFGPRNSDGRSYGLVGDPIPRWIGNFSKLESLYLRFRCEIASPTDLSLPPHLKKLHLECPNLHCLPRLPSSLNSLQLWGCKSLCSLEDLSNLKNLSSLNIFEAAVKEIPGLGCLENLQWLRLSRLQQVEILPDLSNLNKLFCLHVFICHNLVEIQGKVPRHLRDLCIAVCDSLRKLPDPSNLMRVSEVELRNCRELNAEAILGLARQEPEGLQLEGLEQLQILPDLSNSNELIRLYVKNCGNLVEIQELPQYLEVLEICSCGSLQKLPELSSLKNLQRVKIQGCMELNVEAISSLCSEMSVKFEGEDAESEYESEGEGDESEREYVFSESESEYEGEDDESERESEGEDDESECESEGEDEE